MSFASFADAPAEMGSLLPLERDMRVLFYELGVVGVNNLMGYEALQLFTELQKVEPEAAYPLVGLGMLGLATGDFHAAESHFTHPIVAQSPLAPYAQGFLAVSHKLQGNNSGFEAASRAATEASQGQLGSTLSELGQTTIDFSQK
jgi:hypothetical protein